MKTTLTIIAGSDAGRVYELDDNSTLVVGRGQLSHTKINDPRMSRSHFSIRLEGDVATMSDYEGTSGTFLNGKRISEHRLKTGDVIQAGETQLRFDSTKFITADSAAIPSMLPVNKNRVPPLQMQRGQASLVEGKWICWRPRGRMVDSRLSRLAMDSTQSGSPSGLPRWAESRTAANSGFDSGVLTRSTHPGSLGSGQGESSGGCSAVL